MVALRQFHSLENETITIKVPPEFKQYQQAEIIILPIENTPNKITDTEAFIKQFVDAIPDFPDCEADELPEESMIGCADDRRRINRDQQLPRE